MMGTIDAIGRRQKAERPSVGGFRARLENYPAPLYGASQYGLPS